MNNKPMSLDAPKAPARKQKTIVVKIAVAFVAVALIAGSAYLFFRQKEVNTDTAGIANVLVDNYQQQLPSLARAAEQNQNDTAAQKDYAVALYATGDVQRAYEYYQGAIKLSPNEPILYNNLGNAARDLGKYDEAISAYQKSVLLDTKAINSYVNLANLYIFTLSKVDLGIAVYENAIEKNPDIIDLQVQLAIAYEQQADVKKATTLYQAILKSYPNNSAALAGLERVK